VKKRRTCEGATPEEPWFFVSPLFRSKRKKCDITGTLDGKRDLSLMLCAVAGNAARENLPSLRCEAAQFRGVLVVDMVYLINAE